MYHYAVRYSEAAPHPALRRHVHCYWQLQGFALSPQVIYPDGKSELLFHYGTPFNAGGVPQKRMMFAGQLESSIQVQPQGRIGIFGVRFSPAGAWNLLRFRQEEATGQVIAAEQVCRPEYTELAGRILGDASFEERTILLNDFLLARLNSEPARFDGLASLVAEGRLTSRAARNHMAVSERTWERIFLERVGVAPKFLERVGRFRHALRLSSSGRSWADTAATCGYTDQSHLVHDFREFTGSSPTNVNPTC